MNRRELMLALCGATIASAVRAQQVPIIGYLNGTSPDESASQVAAFRQGLSEIGYVEGYNLAIEFRWAEGRYDRLSALAADLITRKVDVIATSGGVPPALAAKNATSTIPIVFVGGDPIAAGLVPSLARPGGNLTGMVFMTAEMIPKRLELLSELMPQTKVIGFLINPNNPVPEPVMRNLREAGHTKGVQLQIVKASTEDQIDAAFATLVQLGAGALILGPDPFLNNRRDQLITLTKRYSIPVIYDFRENAAAGGLISYGPSLTAANREAGIYVGRILKGAKPADLPVQQPTRFELVINLKTAKALGLTIPASILARADEVIE